MGKSRWLRRLGVIALAGLGLGVGARAQVNPPIAKNVPTPEQQAPSVWGGRFVVIASGSMQFASATTANSEPLSTTNVAGFQLGLLTHINQYNAFEFRVSGAEPRQTYGSNLFATSFNTTYSFDYVFTDPTGDWWRPFLLVGASYLKYHPVGSNNTAGAGNQNRPGIDYGGGLDFLIRKNISLRVEYREILYKVPDFDLININKWNRMPIPDIGLAWHF
ncbi:MAG: outer membrane beta-barrel protein [Terriglobales bacterium]